MNRSLFSGRAPVANIGKQILNAAGAHRLFADRLAENPFIHRGLRRQLASRRTGAVGAPRPIPHRSIPANPTRNPPISPLVPLTPI